MSWINLIINTDATMCGYAVDINGDLVDGVVVEVRLAIATSADLNSNVPL